jgi:hypothetical protein
VELPSDRVFLACLVAVDLISVAQIPNLPPPSPLSRWPFVVSRLFRFVAYALVIHFLKANLPMPSIPVGYRCDLKHALFVPAWGLLIAASFRASHALLASASVALGLFQPRDWPDMFGDILKVSSVRMFWG